MHFYFDPPMHLLSGVDKLVEDDPTLLLPANKDKFRAAIESTYDCDHAVFVELRPQEVAAAKMMATHEDDLPRA